MFRFFDILRNRSHSDIDLGPACLIGRKLPFLLRLSCGSAFQALDRIGGLDCCANAICLAMDDRVGESCRVVALYSASTFVRDSLLLKRA